MYQAHFASKAISVHFQVKNCTDAPHELRREMTALYKSLMQGKLEKKRVAELSYVSVWDVLLLVWKIIFMYFNIKKKVPLNYKK